MERGFPEPLPFDVPVARVYSVICVRVRMAGRNPRGRVADLFIAAIAAAHDLPLLTRNADDLRGLETVIDVVSV